jgi:hypothetical protein
MQKFPFQSLKTLNKNDIVGIYLKYNESGFEFNFKNLEFFHKEIPKEAKEFDLDDLEYIPEELQWAANCLKSESPIIWTSESGIVKFGRPYKGEKISDDLEAALFPRHVLEPQQAKPASSTDYFKEYQGKKKKR